VKNLVVLSKLLATHCLNKMRDRNASSRCFREELTKLSYFLAYECAEELETETRSVKTPMETLANASFIKSSIVLGSIMRAGNGMLDPFLQIFPEAGVAHVGIFRNENHQPVEYYWRAPNNLNNKTVLLLDPMLATGGSATKAIEVFKEKGAGKIVFVSIIAAPEGVAKVHEKFPEIKIFTASLDRELNSKAYIVPGLGDAGDRIYGTEH